MDIKQKHTYNFPNSYNFRLENSKNIGKFDPEHFMHCVLHSVQVFLKIIKKNFLNYLDYRYAREWSSKKFRNGSLESYSTELSEI